MAWHRKPKLSSVEFITSFFHWIGIVGFMEELDSTRKSAIGQFAILIVPVERESATKHVW